MPLAVGAASGDPARLPSLSMAGRQAAQDPDGRPPLGMARTVELDEDEVRREVIRRLEARIQQRRQAGAREAAPSEGSGGLEGLRARLDRAVLRARDLPEPDLPDSGQGDFPPEEAGPQGQAEVAGMRGSVEAPPPEEDPASPQGFVSPEVVRTSLPWAPPEDLAGQEQGILPPEVTGVSTPRRRIEPEPMVRPAARPWSAPQGIQEHVLQAGETLWALARRYGLSVQDLIRANAIADVDGLSVGTRLRIPDPGAPAPDPAFAAPNSGAPVRAAGRYQVERGDSLYKIARAHQVTVDELLRANPQITAAHLAPGMQLVIPDPRLEASRVDPPAARLTVPPAPPAALEPRPVRAPSGSPPSAPTPTLLGTGGSGNFAWPVSGTVTAGFGWKDGKPHTGVDISAHLGTVVRAAAAGKVIFSGQMRDYGNVVILDHQDGFFTVYAHNEQNLVAKGGPADPTLVRAGQALARVGATGDAVAPQLHFEVRKLNQAVDPLRYLAPRGGDEARVLPGRP